jgi:glycosyltransferase involved in cell wall biosynthesis
LLPKDAPKPKLFLAGRPEVLGPKLTALAKDANVDFTLLGPRADIPELLQAADIFVLPSHEEGSSNALLEAVVSGTPAVATSVGGNAELLLGGAGGWLCEAQAPSKLALALSEVLKNPSQGQERAEKARTAALEGRDVRALVHRHMRLYDRIAPLSAAS